VILFFISSLFHHIPHIDNITQFITINSTQPRLAKNVKYLIIPHISCITVPNPGFTVQVYSPADHSQSAQGIFSVTFTSIQFHPEVEDEVHSTIFQLESFTYVFQSNVILHFASIARHTSAFQNSHGAGVVDSAKALFHTNKENPRTKINIIFFMFFVNYKVAKSSRKVYEARSISVAITVFTTILLAFFTLSSFHPAVI
jgi:hypothetical protein